MRQEINLYQPIFRKQKKVFSSVALLQASGVVFLGLLMVYAFGLWRVQVLDDELVSLKDQRSAAARRLENLSRQLPEKSRSALLEAEVQRLARDLQRRRKVEELLTSGAYGNREGFSEHLAGLARQHIDGLWLKNLEISEASKDVGLVGSALHPELVPQYVQRFSAEPALAGMRFQTLRMERPDTSRSRVDFELRTVTAGP
ncbi:MAG: hypothetical protein QNK18_14385 [Gammaproteobacteria bacterium]|nr:hypothetical protein [Gammaproteobacteria bacterium]